jgi:hypothetical protein
VFEQDLDYNYIEDIGDIEDIGPNLEEVLFDHLGIMN